MNFIYYVGAFLSLPFLPLMRHQGEQIKKSVPILPEAENPEGHCTSKNATKTLKLITIGESTIAGVGVKTHQEGFTGSLAENLAKHLQTNISWKVYARSGYNAYKVTENILPKITEENADLIVIGLGGNDAFQLHTPKTFQDAMEKLLKTLKNKFPEAVIVLCDMPPIKDFPAFTPLIKLTIGNLVELLGNQLSILVKDYKNVYYKNEKITVKKWIKKLDVQATKADFFSDGVHPSPFAYQVWGKEMANRIAEEKEIKKALVLP